MEQNTHRRFQICLIELEKINDTLSELYLDSNNLYNHKIGIFKIFRKLVINLRFMYETSEVSSQQITLSLGRMIIDHYSILYLLSTHSSRKEQLLRYYLYLIDSLQSRINTIQDFSSNFSEMSEEILKNNEISNSHDQNVVIKLKEFIFENKLNDIANEKDLENSNWKFVSSHPAKKNVYSWQELYNISKIPEHFSKAIQNHFSTFTHGLGMTILYSEDNPESTLYVYEFVTLIQALIGKMMLLNYPEELKNLELRQDFLDSGEAGWNDWK
ncbi:MAG: hypothetical protein CFE23_16645 [Flavobacterium sp. BFFFF1]|uniref:hypothetical protein n=1 Tax=Flavobacterium sp. BFFFF1 TaxID=2015557 RepID=UPI000BDC0878|nr:hypothetical protein [Flavobacterium sp. BFFFF1]OYU78862.1 MAG: hypothetical protein CFE23_16645 [Flavobacterium sp. BFFFF1]